MKRLPDGIQILLARMVLCGFLSGALLIFMHELGHGIAALAAGAKITQFSVLKGFIETDGGKRGFVIRQLFYAAGQIFPWISAMAYALFYRRNGDGTYRIFSFLYEAVCVFSLFDWILTPFLWMMNCAPKGDDCTMFLGAWPYSPLFVSGIFLAAASCLILTACWRGIAADFVRTVQSSLDNRA